MGNIVAGLIAVGSVVLFLGYYAYRVVSVPFWLIIIAIVAMIIFDFRDSLSESENGE